MHNDQARIGHGVGPFTSLAGVSFPAAAVASTALALENGWPSGQSMYNTGNPGCAVKGGVVSLSGSMHSAGTSRLAFTLPKAARPAREMSICEYAFDGTTGWLQIPATGQVYVYGSTSAAYMSLAGVSFPVASAKLTYFKLAAPGRLSFNREPLFPDLTVIRP